MKSRPLLKRVLCFCLGHHWRPMACPEFDAGGVRYRARECTRCGWSRCKFIMICEDRDDLLRFRHWQEQFEAKLPPDASLRCKVTEIADWESSDSPQG